MTNGDKIRQMSDEELISLIENEPWCRSGKDCSYTDTCGNCLHYYIKAENIDDILESKREGFFECSMTNCVCCFDGKCTNPCYLDCTYYSLRQSLRELVKKYEEIVVHL